MLGGYTLNTAVLNGTGQEEKLLSGSVSGLASSLASLGLAVAFSAGVFAAGSTSATASLSVSSSAEAVVSCSASGDLSLDKPLVGEAQGILNATAVLAVNEVPDKLLAATTTASCGIFGELRCSVGLSSMSVATGAAQAQLEVGVFLAAHPTTAVSTTAALGKTSPLSGDGTASVSIVQPPLAFARLLSGAGVGSTTATGAASLGKPLTANAATLCLTGGALSSQKTAAGSTTAACVAQAALRVSSAVGMFGAEVSVASIELTVSVDQIELQWAA